MLALALLSLLCHAAAGVAHEPCGGEGDVEQRAPAHWSPSVLAEELERHVRFLAADELRGRRAGSEDTLRAARYIAGVLEASGVQPAGDDGGYLQSFPLIGFRHRSLPRLSAVDRPGAEEAQGERTLAPTEYELRVDGWPRSTEALAVVTAHTAEQIPVPARPDAALFLETSRVRARGWLRRNDPGDGPRWGLIVVLGDEAPSPEAGQSARGRDPMPVSSEPEEPEWVVAHADFARALAAGEVESLRLTFDLEVLHGREQNVVGFLPAAGDGDRPPAGRSAVVVSAHYDHIGMLPEGTDVSGGESLQVGAQDRVFNGADDDASGVACVLELAGALASDGPAARPVVFLLATAEEVGLWGTEHYLEHPVVPLEQTLMNLNFEMVGRPDPLLPSAGRMWLTGFERTNLGPELREVGLDIEVDPRPEQHFFQRSDNFAFVRRGIVGQSLSSFGMHDDYHQLGDEPDTLDYAHLETCTRTALEALRHIVRGRIDPRWAEDEPRPSRR